MNNNVTKKADVLVPEAFLAFLGNCLIHLMVSGEREVEEQLLENIDFFSTHIASYNEFYQAFLANPQEKFLEDIKLVLDKYKTYDSSRAFSALFLAIH